MRSYTRKSPHNLDKNIVKNVEKLYKRGVPKIVIAEVLGIGRVTVWRMVKLHGWVVDNCTENTNQEA